MKKSVVMGEELYEKMEKAINLLCNTVKSTLGPSGNNVIINSSLPPFITNDGVTIAENIESEDMVENTILTIAKEASIKTNELVGDGTTTTLVLLQSIFNDGLKLIRNGCNPIKLKENINKTVNIVVNELEKIKRDCTPSDLLNIACISANDEKIGSLISEVYNKTNYIKIDESYTDETSYEIVNGYKIDSSVVSNYFFNNKKEINLKNAYILLTVDVIESVYELHNIIDQIEKNKSIVIIAEDFSEEVVNEMVMENYQNTLNVVLIKSSGYGKNKYDILDDISVLTNSKVYNSCYGESINDAKLCDLGNCKEVKIDSESTTIISALGNRSYVEKHKNNIVKEIDNCISGYEKELLEDRLAKLDKGIAIINVGASTNVERREKKMRYEDALCALNACKEGVIVGEGLSLLIVQNLIKSDVSNIVIDSLSKPFMQIMENLGYDKNEMFNKIKENKFDKTFNTKTEKFENASISNIIDPYLVVKNEIINASSIAGMLLTTKYLVINEQKSNLDLSVNEVNI